MSYLTFGLITLVACWSLLGCAVALELLLSCWTAFLPMAKLPTEETASSALPDGLTPTKKLVRSKSDGIRANLS